MECLIFLSYIFLSDKNWILLTLFLGVARDMNDSPLPLLSPLSPLSPLASTIHVGQHKIDTAQDCEQIGHQ